MPGTAARDAQRSVVCGRIKVESARDRKGMGLQQLVLAPCMLAWAIGVATVHLEPKQPIGYGVPFDYFYLSTYVLGARNRFLMRSKRLTEMFARLIAHDSTWVPSFCQIEGRNMQHCNYKANNKGFLIHGLWPNFRNGSWPQFCPGPPFKSGNINDLEEELEKYWPESLEGLKRDVLWKHEWSKHGTCATSSIPSMHDYFATTLSLFKTIDFYKGFQKGKISPQGGSTYKTREILQALTYASPAKTMPVVVCKNGKLFEVRYCIDKLLNFVECNAAQMSDLHFAACPSKVFLPRELSFSTSNTTSQSL